MRSEAIVFTALHTVELLPIDLPALAPGEALLETIYTMISPGTEMRTLAGGEFEHFPFVAGYAAVGKVIEVAPGCGLKLGQLVFSGGTQKASLPLGWGGHTRHAVVHGASVTPLPEGVDPLEAVGSTLAAISYHGAQVSRPQPGEKVAVVGLGPIGYMSVLCHMLSGADVVGIDTEPWRVEKMCADGAQAVLSEGSIAQSVEKHFGAKADLVVDATGVPAVLAHCVEAVKDLSWQWNSDADHGARVLIQGSYPGDVPVPYRKSFMRELRFLIPRNFIANDLRDVLALIQAGRLKPSGLVSEVLAPKDAPEAYRRLVAREKGVLSFAFKWTEACTRWDLNPKPLPSEGSTLSS